MKSISVFVSILICLCSCVQKPNGHSSDDSLSAKTITANSDTPKIKAVNQDTSKKNPQEDTLTKYPPEKNTLYFQPYVYNLAGTLRLETFYDSSPGKGKTYSGEKEDYYVLVLDHSVNVIIYPGDESDPLHSFDAPVKDIKKLQVILDFASDSLLLPHLNKRITLKGKLFGPQNGHHHTEILIEASSIVK